MKSKIIFTCANCGQTSPKWMGHCTSCNSWNTYEEKTVKVGKGNVSSSTTKQVKTIKLSEVISSNSDRIITSINEFNRVMGGGIVKDSVTIMTAKPGAGKSTLLLQVANDIASKGNKVLYASGEESESQIKRRADRILPQIHSDVWVMADTSLDNVVATVEQIDPDLIIIDSIQTFTLEAFPGSRAGSPTQTMECASEMLKIAKNNARPRAVIMVGINYNIMIKLILSRRKLHRSVENYRIKHNSVLSFFIFIWIKLKK